MMTIKGRRVAWENVGERPDKIKVQNPQNIQKRDRIKGESSTNPGSIKRKKTGQFERELTHS